jgi:hypothetical protein
VSRRPARTAQAAPATDPPWLRPAVLALASVLLFGLFSPGIVDSDFWWHLRTGQYIVEQRTLPVPDPFAWTTASAPLAYPSEARTRQFNLTHEWLAQVLLFVTWRVGGAAGIVAMRALSMTLVCAIAGLVTRRRSGSFYGGLAGALACASVLQSFALDRPFQITFVFLAATIAILEFRRYLWLLPVIFLVWANCHGGYFLGFVVLGAYAAEALWLRKRERNLWIVAGLCLAAAAINPNGLGIFRTLLDYRTSYLTSRLLEWSRPRLWPPSAFSVLLIVAAALMLWQRRKVRVADWLLLAAFAAASLSAQRNTVFIGLVAPVLIAGCWPWGWSVPTFVRMAFPALAVAGIAAGVIAGSFFQLRAEEWKYPRGAADFLRAHRITQPLFNTYEHGGYLIWRLWPMQRVFIDGRALSESLFMDYARILYNHDNNDGQPSGEQLLDRYGIQAIVMNTFEPATGNVYVLAPALADPAQKTWKLVYNDAESLIFLRNPPPDVTALNSLDVLTHMETECRLHLEHEPQYPLCARSLGDVFLKVGDTQRARRWLGIYLESLHGPDAAAEQAYQRLLSQ